MIMSVDFSSRGGRVQAFLEPWFELVGRLVVSCVHAKRLARRHCFRGVRK